MAINWKRSEKMKTLTNNKLRAIVKRGSLSRAAAQYELRRRRKKKKSGNK